MKIYNAKLLEGFGRNGKLNIAIVSDIYKPFVGGVTTVVEDLANNLKDKCNVVLFCQDGKIKDNDDFPIVRCKTIPFIKSIGDIPVPNLDFKLKKLFKSLKIDVIHIHTFFGLASFALKMAKKLKTPVVYHGHTKLYDEYLSMTNCKSISKILTKKAVKKLNKATEIWAVSEGTKNIYKSLGVTKPLKVVRNTTKFDYLDDQKFVKAVKEKFNIRSSRVAFFMSRMEINTKNIDFLLRATRLALNSLDFQLIFTGGGADYDKIIEMTKTLKICDKCVFTGEIRDQKTREALYQIADLFVFPSVCDTAGIVILEAASQKTPTLCIAKTFPAEIIVDGKNGYLSKLDEKVFAENMIKIFKSKNRKIVGENAYKQLLNKDVYQKIYERYKELVKNKY